MKYLAVVLGLAFFGASLSFGQSAQPNQEVGNVQENPNGSTTLKLDGLDIDFDAAGNWSAIYSTYTHPVDFTDRRGIKKAQLIAEEKGKAQIIRFLNQAVESDRLVEEVDKTVQNADRIQESGKDDKITRSTHRQMVESVKEFTHSHSSGNLVGVTILGEGYDEKAEEAWVKIGISRKTISVANSLGKSLSGGPAGDSAPASSAPKQGSGSTLVQPSEDRGTRTIPQ
jgi:hypothetical protein